MKLHSFDWKGTVSQPHDFAVGRSRAHFKAGWHCRFLDNQRVIARCLEGVRHTCKDRSSVVFDKGSFSVHEPRSTDDIAAVALANGLVAQTDAEDRDFAT